MLKTALEAAKKGGFLAEKYFNNLPKVNFKSDKSPFTIADIETEKLIRKIISSKYPDHGIIGEELPPINPKSNIQWVIDPIDGTRDFVRGIPFWATYIAVLKTNKPILGVVFMPSTNDMMTAKLSEGAFLNGKKTKVSKTKKLSDAYISFGQLKRFEKQKKVRELVNLCKTASASRGYGNLGFKFLIEGKIDISLESYGGLYDFAAPSIILKEAGGEFSDFSGKFSLTTGNGVYSNGLLHQQIIKILNS